jgi:hypothetical protein
MRRENSGKQGARPSLSSLEACSSNGDTLICGRNFPPAAFFNLLWQQFADK